jgi:recombination protein RecT
MSNQQVATRAPQPANAIVALRNDLERMQDQFKFALPAHIPPARFIRVVMTAVQNSPRLLKCEQKSFFNACMKCAQDGLLPDGREAALVPYGDDPDSGQGKADIAQYLPMIAGIRKKVRNSGLLRDWNVQVVQQGDAFDYQLGDDPFIRHKPAAHGGRGRPVQFAYSIATYPDGTKSREVMNIDQIKDIQSKSKAKRGPWSDPIFYPEMCRKTVAKLHAKQLPMSTDLDTLLRRDEELYDFKGERERAQRANDLKPPPSVGAALDIFGATPLVDEPQEELARPEDHQHQQRPDEGGGAQHDTPNAGAAPPSEPPPSAPADDPIAVARRQGYEARVLNLARKAIPGDLRAPERSGEAQAWQAGWDDANGAGSAKPGTGPLIVLATLAVLAMSLAPAFATCITDYRNLPADHGWRHYRIVDGAHCWYVGRGDHHSKREIAQRPPKLMPSQAVPISTTAGRDALAFAGNAEPPAPQSIAFDGRWIAVAMPAPTQKSPELQPEPEPAAPIAHASVEPTLVGALAAGIFVGIALAVRPKLRDARRRRDTRWRMPPIRDLNSPGVLT